jgi:hypothetical protein
VDHGVLSRKQTRNRLFSVTTNSAPLSPAWKERADYDTEDATLGYGTLTRARSPLGGNVVRGSVARVSNLLERRLECSKHGS